MHLYDSCNPENEMVEKLMPQKKVMRCVGASIYGLAVFVGCAFLLAVVLGQFFEGVIWPWSLVPKAGVAGVAAAAGVWAFRRAIRAT